MTKYWLLGSQILSISRSVRKKKSLVKYFWINKKDLSISCFLKESASILEQASRSYGDVKLGVFVTK